MGKFDHGVVTLEYVEFDLHFPLGVCPHQNPRQVKMNRMLGSEQEYHH